MCNLKRKKENNMNWADLAKTHGLKVIEQYLTEKELI